MPQVTRVTHPHVWHDSFISATWLIHKCDMTHSQVRHDSITAISRVTHPHVIWPNSPAIGFITHTLTHTCTHTHTRTHAHTHTRTRKHTHTHTRTPIYLRCASCHIHSPLCCASLHTHSTQTAEYNQSPPASWGMLRERIYECTRNSWVLTNEPYKREYIFCKRDLYLYDCETLVHS